VSGATHGAEGTTRSSSVRSGGRPRSLFALVQDVPSLVTDLVKGEIAMVKLELVRTLKALGIGAGFLVGALVLVFAMLGVLLTAAVLALSLVMPGWAAALVVAGVLLLAALLLAFLGYRHIKAKGLPLLPERTIAGLQRDLAAVKGVGRIPAATVDLDRR